MDVKEYSDVVQSWMEQVLANRGVNAELTLKYCSEIEKYAIKTGDSKLLGFSYYHFGETFYVLNEGESLFRYMTRALSYLDSSGQWELVARAYNIMAITSVNRGNEPIAMDYYLTGLNYCKKYGLEQVEMIINLNMGNLYMSCDQYKEAQVYIESAYRFIKEQKNQPEYYSYLLGVYAALGECYMMRNMFDKAQGYVDRIETECASDEDIVDRLCVHCFKAQLYHKMGRYARRDESITFVQKYVDRQMAIMDVFSDFYKYSELLLEIDKDDELWNMLEILEQLTKQAKIINLQRSIIALKIKYYRKHEKNAEYLQAAGLYYALTEVMEKENQYMVINMLNVRSSLELANAKRREIEKENVMLQQRSETDPLTGLSNRFRLNTVTEDAFQNAYLEKKSLAIEILDIDYFKQFNDNYGHQEGDRCINAIASELKNLQNESIFCARYGGDEFVIVYQGMTMEEVLEKSNYLRKQIFDLRIEHKYSKALPIVSISQGICWSVPREENKTWDYLHVADSMLYKVKEKNRNGICMGSLDSTEIFFQTGETK